MAFARGAQRIYLSSIRDPINVLHVSGEALRRAMDVPAGFLPSQNTGSTDVSIGAPPTPDYRLLAGNRIPIRDGQLGDVTRFGPSVNPDGRPTFVATLILEPFRAYPGLIRDGKALTAYKNEQVSRDAFDVLPITDQMQWIDSSRGTIPSNCNAIVGGHELESPLYHALAKTGDQWTLGWTSGQYSSTEGAWFVTEDGIVPLSSGYKVLCWK
ncbi:hypothetical protein OIO90_006633 [Microbotryomycetes sp. JL221]|nr:hypothetical protein OIO90_006633 [Microbotryomycetes sp. JL221]